MLCQCSSAGLFNTRLFNPHLIIIIIIIILHLSLEMKREKKSVFFSKVIQEKKPQILGD